MKKKQTKFDYQRNLEAQNVKPVKVMLQGRKVTWEPTEATEAVKRRQVGERSKDLIVN